MILNNAKTKTKIQHSKKMMSMSIMTVKMTNKINSVRLMTIQICTMMEMTRIQMRCMVMKIQMRTKMKMKKKRILIKLMIYWPVVLIIHVHTTQFHKSITKFNKIYNIFTPSTSNNSNNKNNKSTSRNPNISNNQNTIKILNSMSPCKVKLYQLRLLWTRIIPIFQLTTLQLLTAQS